MLLKGNLKEIGQFIKEGVHLFIQDSCPSRAAGLAFNTLLALVPLSAVIFSIFSGFGVLNSLQESIKDFLVSTLVPASQVEILSYIEGFIQNTRTLGVAGFSIFLVTSLLLIMNVDRNFNDIWKTKKRKRPIETISTYIAVLLMGSLLIALSFSLSTWIQSQIRSELFFRFGALLRLFIRFTPWFSIMTAFFIMNLFIPHEAVRPKYALIAAVAGAIVWELSKYYFSLWAGLSVRNSIIYGSLALIPLFLFWLNLAWMIVLGQLEIANLLDKRGKGLVGRDNKTSPLEELSMGVTLFRIMGDTLSRENRSSTLSALNQITGFSQPLIQRLLTRLVEVGLIHETTSGGYLAPPEVPFEDLWTTFVGSPLVLKEEESLQNLGDLIDRHLKD